MIQKKPISAVYQLLLILITILIPSIVTYAEEKSLTLWIMPNESPVPQKPTNEEIDKFLADNPNIINTPSELKSNKDFARDVLGQTTILELINKYKEERRFDSQINLRILKWPTAFGEIEDAISCYKERFAPDIVQLGSSWTAYFAHKKALANISEVVDKNLYFEPSMRTCQIPGSKKIYAIPFLLDVRLLYYWKEAVGDPEIDLRDWQALNKTCRRIQKAIENGKIRGMKSPIGFPIAPNNPDVLHHLAIWLWGAGAEIVEVKKIFNIFPIKRANLDSKEALDAVHFLKELTAGSQLSELHSAELEKRFVNGEFEMFISGEWMIKRLKDRFGDDWKRKIGIAPIPAGPAGRVTFVGGSNLAVFRVVKNRGNLDMALDFLLFLSDKEIQSWYAKSTGLLSASKEVLNAHIEQDLSYRIVKQALEYGKSYPSLPEWAIIVEKEVTLNNLYRFWKHTIIDQRDIREIRLDLEIANQVLNDGFGSIPKQIFEQVQDIILYTLGFLLGGCFILIVWKVWKKLHQNR